MEQREKGRIARLKSEKGGKSLKKFDANLNSVKLPLILLLVPIISSQVLVFPRNRK